MSRGPTQQIRYPRTLRVSSAPEDPDLGTPPTSLPLLIVPPLRMLCAHACCARALRPPAEDDQRPSSCRAESAQEPSRCDSRLQTGVSSPSSRRITMSWLVGCHLNVRSSTRSEVRRGHRYPTAQDAEVRGGIRVGQKSRHGATTDAPQTSTSPPCSAG